MEPVAGYDNWEDTLLLKIATNEVGDIFLC